MSTNHALLDVITNCYDNINHNLFTSLIFLDLTKAFDSVNHDILLHKLDHYGIRGQALDLIRSFLNRKQYVAINGKKSKLLSNRYGVPQGSILGPLLFLIFINDIPSSVKCIPRLFADDTCLAISSPNLTTLTLDINIDLENISKWFKVNKLTVNPSKSAALIIPPKLNKFVPNINITLDNSPIPQSHRVKYLGTTIDSKLKFDSHIEDVERKISKAVGIITKLTLFMPKNVLLKIYYSSIHPHLLYGVLIWGATFPSYLKKL